MPLLLIPVGRWKATELFALLWCQWKTHISERTYMMHRTRGLFAPCNTPEQLERGRDGAARPTAAFPGDGGWGNGTKVPLASLAQAHVLVLVTAAATVLSMEGGNFHQASRSHQTCHLSHSASLVPANTCLQHTLTFVTRFPLGTAPSSEFSSTNLGVALCLCFKMTNCSSTSSSWGMRQSCWQAQGTSPYSCPQLLVPAFPECWHWGARLQPPG